MTGDALRESIPTTQADGDSRASRVPPYRAGTARATILEAPFYRSIRFRLTMWYAIAMIALIIAMAISLHTMLARALTSDAESRMRNAAGEIAEEMGVATELDDEGEPLPVDLTRAELVLDVDSILLSGLWFQIVNSSHEILDVDSSGALEQSPADLESALGDSSVFSMTDQTLMTIEVDGSKSLVLVAPLTFTVGGEQGPNAGWVIVGESLGARDQIIDVVNSILRIFGVFGVAIALWGGWLMAGRALAPLGRITHTADIIAADSNGAVTLSRRLDVPKSGDELSQMATTFNGMLDRIEAAFETQRRFVGDASHELRTPLTSVRGNIDVLLRQLKSERPVEREDLVAVLGVVQSESGRMSRLIDDMLELARSDSTSQGDLLKRNMVSLDAAAEQAFRTAEQLASGQRLELTVAEPFTLFADGDRLVQVMLIFLDNAFRHTPAGGKVELRIDRAVDPECGVECARIEVTDSGGGISPEHVQHVFERFYRAENARSRESGGSGLGLSIALAIVRGHGGWIDVDTTIDEGTSFMVWVPLAQQEEPGNGHGAGADPPPPQPWWKSWRPGRSAKADASRESFQVPGSTDDT